LLHSYATHPVAAVRQLGGISPNSSGSGIPGSGHPKPRRIHPGQPSRPRRLECVCLSNCTWPGYLWLGFFEVVRGTTAVLSVCCCGFAGELRLPLPPGGSKRLWSASLASVSASEASAICSGSRPLGRPRVKQIHGLLQGSPSNRITSYRNVPYRHAMVIGSIW
jgi:hypothetical protein